MNNSPEVQFWLEVISALGSLLSGLGLIFAAVGMIYLVRQTRSGERATTATVYQSIAALGNSINDMFINEPELFTQISAGSQFPADKTVVEEQRANPKRFFAASQWLDYFEMVLVLWSAIPRHLHEPWRNYIRSHLADSPYLQHLVLNTSWYGDDLMQLCREAQRATQQGAPADGLASASLR